MSAGLAVTRAERSGGDGPRASPKVGGPARGGVWGAPGGGDRRRASRVHPPCCSGPRSRLPGLHLRPRARVARPADLRPASPACRRGTGCPHCPGHLPRWDAASAPGIPASVQRRPAGPVTPDSLQPALQDCLLPKWQDLTSKSSCHSSLFGRQL